jgi:hypothetical protein
MLVPRGDIAVSEHLSIEHRTSPVPASKVAEGQQTSPISREFAPRAVEIHDPGGQKTRRESFVLDLGSHGFTKLAALLFHA